MAKLNAVNQDHYVGWAMLPTIVVTLDGILQRRRVADLKTLSSQARGKAINLRQVLPPLRALVAVFLGFQRF
jgi:hypothetical protein